MADVEGSTADLEGPIMVDPEAFATRCADLLARLADTHNMPATALDRTPAGPESALLYHQIADDLRAMFVQRAWELLDGNPTLLSDFGVARRTLKASGLKVHGDVILTYAEAVAPRVGKCADTLPLSIAADDLGGRCVLASVVAVHRLVHRHSAMAFGDAAAPARAGKPEVGTEAIAEDAQAPGSNGEPELAQ